MSLSISKIFLVTFVIGLTTSVTAITAVAEARIIGEGGGEDGVDRSSSALHLAQSSEGEFGSEDFLFLVDQCLALSRETDYEKTLEACEQAIMERPNDPNIELWSARSQALFQLGQYPEAIASFNRVLRSAPNDSISLAYQCASLVQLERYDNAVDTCETALQINGNWGDRSPGFAWYQRGLALQQLGRLTTALTSFERATQNQPESAIYRASECAVAIEIGAFANCQPRIATLVYEQAIALQPDNVELWFQQGLALEQLGDYERALVSYEQAIALAPDHSLILAHQCAVLNQLHDYETALAACEAAFEGNGLWGRIGPAYGWVQHSSSLIGLGEYEAALASAERAIDLGLALNLEETNLRGSIELEGFDLQEAAYPPAFSNRAVALWHLERYAEALDAIDRSRAIYEGLVDSLGENFERTYPEPPILFYRGQILTLYNWGRILSAQGQHEGAIAAYQAASNAYDVANRFLPDLNLVSNTTRANILTNLAVAYLRNGQPRPAYDRATDAVRQEANFTTLYNQGITALAVDNPVAALDAFQQANQLNPDNLYVITGQGIALASLDCRQAALAVFDQALNIVPGYARAAYERNQLLMGNSDGDDAPNPDTPNTDTTDNSEASDRAHARMCADYLR